MHGYLRMFYQLYGSIYLTTKLVTWMISFSLTLSYKSMSFQPGSSGDEVASVIFGGNTSAHADDTTPICLRLRFWVKVIAYGLPRSVYIYTAPGGDVISSTFPLPVLNTNHLPRSCLFEAKISTIFIHYIYTLFKCVYFC